MKEFNILVENLKEQIKKLTEEIVVKDPSLIKNTMFFPALMTAFADLLCVSVKVMKKDKNYLYKVIDESWDLIKLASKKEILN